MKYTTNVQDCGATIEVRNIGVRLQSGGNSRTKRKVKWTRCRMEIEISYRGTRIEGFLEEVLEEFASVEETNKPRRKEKRLIQQPRLAVVEETTIHDAVTSSPRQFDHSFSCPLLRESHHSILTCISRSFPISIALVKCDKSDEDVSDIRRVFLENSGREPRFLDKEYIFRSFQRRKDRAKSLMDHLRN